MVFIVPLPLDLIFTFWSSLRFLPCKEEVKTKKERLTVGTTLVRPERRWGMSRNGSHRVDWSLNPLFCFVRLFGRRPQTTDETRSPDVQSPSGQGSRGRSTWSLKILTPLQTDGDPKSVDSATEVTVGVDNWQNKKKRWKTKFFLNNKYKKTQHFKDLIQTGYNRTPFTSTILVSEEPVYCIEGTRSQEEIFYSCYHHCGHVSRPITPMWRGTDRIEGKILGKDNSSVR